MHFSFVDRITELQPGVKITTLKCLSLAEEYLGDHFPRFPVMPGVLMLQAMTQASAMLLQATENFAHSMVTLKEARNVRYADFVRPGHVLTVTSEIAKIEPREVQFKAQGTLDGRLAVSGRLTLERYNLADSRPELADNDAHLKRHLKAQLELAFQLPVDSTANNSAVISPLDPASEPGRGKAESSPGKV